MACLVSVAIPVPSLDALTYRVPDAFGRPAVGARVLVPLGTRTVTGLVTTFVSGRPETQRSSKASIEQDVRDVIDVLDDGPFLPADVVDLGVWVADYYACGVGEALSAAVPPRAWIESELRARITEEGRAHVSAGVAGEERAFILKTLASGPHTMRLSAMTGRGVRRRRGLAATLRLLERDGLVELQRPLKGSASAFKTVRVWSAAETGKNAGGAPDGRVVTGQQLKALDMLRISPEGLTSHGLAAGGIGAATLRRLASRGLVVSSRRVVERDPFLARGSAFVRISKDEGERAGPRSDVVLSDEQTEALQRLHALADKRVFAVALLHGITGSGKTEIYVRLARFVSDAGLNVLVLVPEIALTPMVATAFRNTFGDRVAIQHSGLSSGERHDQWQRIRRGEIDIVVGTRSAVFAPLPSVGLIIVDEEHDGSYKQEENPRYNGRDVAVMRGKRANALVVLGSATPSLESYQNALNGRYTLITLERRVLDRKLAMVRIVDMREEYASHGADVVLSEPLQQGLSDRLERGEQSVVLLNRRGFAVAIFCRQCGHTLECPNCSVSLTVHRAVRRARCHYCNYSMTLPTTCSRCAGPYLEQLGFGTERVEAEITAVFPEARVARLDRDTVRRRGAAHRLLDRFARREIDVLVGTQMIAKGHDFPGITLVGVISADVGLGLADFRAAERTFQLLTQVAGRAGRGEQTGEAIIQTLYPTHYSIRHACRQDYVAFFEDEIKFRREMRYPPAVALVNVIIRARTAQDAISDAADVARRLRSSFRGVRVLGPAPAPLGRIRGEYRAQLFLKGKERTAMRAAVKAVLKDQRLRRRITVDVDPLTVL